MRVLSILLLFLLTECLFAQERQYVDIPPTGKQDYLPYEGGSVAIKIDRNTSLDDLIQRLKYDWELRFTGKGYWIGYTDDMFSIAARKDSAIRPLLDIIDNSSNIRERTGAIYCLHLIGIDRRIAGRFYEEFVVLKARKALLYSLRYTELQQTVIKLLIRDPRLSDVSDIFKAMCNSNDNCWTLVNGLSRYGILDFPILQSIPDTVMNLSVGLKYSKSNIIEHDFDFEGQFQELLDSINNLGNDYIFVDEALLNSEVWGSYRHKLANGWVRRGEQGVHLGKFLNQVTNVDYLRLGNKISYYVEEGRVYVCSPAIAQKKLCNWWSELSDETKKNLNNDKPLFR